MAHLTLHITETGVFYAADQCWTWGQTNLPKPAFTLRRGDDVYWVCAQTAYAAASRTLSLRVVNYDAEAVDFDPTLRPKAPVERVIFAPLDEQAFLSQLSYYRRGELRDFLATDAEAFESATSELPEKREAEARPPSSGRPVHFRYPLADLEFLAGAAAGRVELPGVAEAVDFRVRNPHIIPEFRHVRGYLIKRLGRKTAEVRGELRFGGDGTVELHAAHSPQIAAINDQLLAVMRTRGLRDLLNLPPERVVDKSLFTPDELFDSLDDDHLGKATLPDDGQALLDAILSERHVRNARHLRFLAGELHLAEAPLRFVLSPSFGFVFLARGREGHHFILELLDSHATYVWSLPRADGTLAEQYRRIEKELAILREIGREGYRRAGTFGAEFWFLVHASAQSGVVDGFPRWRNRLLEGVF